MIKCKLYTVLARTCQSRPDKTAPDQSRPGHRHTEEFNNQDCLFAWVCVCVYHSFVLPDHVAIGVFHGMSGFMDSREIYSKHLEQMEMGMEMK